MKQYIIVKYAVDLWPNNKAPFWVAVHPNTYTAEKCGISENYFIEIGKANEALKKLEDYNPTVGYGIVEVIER